MWRCTHGPPGASAFSLRRRGIRKRIASGVGEVVHQIVVPGIHGVELLPRSVEVRLPMHAVLVEEVGQYPPCPRSIAAEVLGVCVEVRGRQRAVPVEFVEPHEAPIVRLLVLSGG
jgi:hypothetical protein